MTCPDCQARQRLVRDAWINALTNPAKAVKQTAIGVAELSGLKSKTGAAELAQSQPVPTAKRSKKHER